MTSPPGVPACRDEDPELFASTLIADHEIARLVCARCPVVDWCLAERDRQRIRSAVGFGPVGTWGGRLYDSEGRVVVIEHGTDRGWEQHRHRQEPACPACVEAHRASRRDRNRIKAGATQ